MGFESPWSPPSRPLRIVANDRIRNQESREEGGQFLGRRTLSRVVVWDSRIFPCGPAISCVTSSLTKPIPGISVLFENHDLFSTLVPPSAVRALVWTTTQSREFSRTLTISSASRVRLTRAPLPFSSFVSPTFQLPKSRVSVNSTCTVPLTCAPAGGVPLTTSTSSV